MCAASEFLNSRTGQWLREKCSLTEAAGNSRRGSAKLAFYPCPSLRGLVLKSLRHGDVTAGARAAERRRSDANGKKRHIGLFDTQEAAAHAVNAAIRRAGLEGKRRTNPVVDGQLVPKSGPRRGPMRKRRRDEPAATPSPRARRPRRTATYVDSEPDADDDEDLELAPPDDEDGWD